MIDYDGWKKHQNETYNEIVEMLKTNDRVCCVRYTGYGKSSALIQRLYKELNGEKLIITASNSLKNSFITSSCTRCITYRELHDKTKVDANKFLNLYNDIKYVILDETHLAAAKKQGKSLKLLLDRIKPKLIGFTATPIRPSDGINIVNYMYNGIQVKPFNLDDGIKNNFVKKVKYIKAYFNIEKYVEEYKRECKKHVKYLNLSKIKIDNMYNIDAIIKKYYSKDINGNKIIVFCPRVNTLDEYKNYYFKIFRKLYPKDSISTFTWSYKDKLDEVYNKFTSCKDDISILFAVDKANHGIHLSEVNTVIFMRKTASEIIYLQQLGRAINKLEPLVFDFSNNCDNIYVLSRKDKSDRNSHKKHKRGNLLDLVELIDYEEDFNKIYKKVQEISKELSDDELDYLLSHNEVAYIKDIAKELGYSSVKLEKYCKEKNIPYIKFHKDLSSLDRKFIDDNMYKMTKRKIAREIIKKRSAYSKINKLYSNAVNTLEQSLTKYYSDKFDKKYIDEEKNKVYSFRVDYIKNNYPYKTTTTLARELHCHPKEVQTILKQNNWKTMCLSYVKLPETTKNKINAMYNILSKYQICKNLKIKQIEFDSFIASDEFNPIKY